MTENDDPREFAKRLLDTDILRNDIISLGPDHGDPDSVVDALIKIAAPEYDRDTNDYDVLNLLLTGYLKSNEPVPDWLATFGANVLEGTIKRPTKRGPDEYTNFERDYRLARAVQKVAKDYSLPRYHINEESKKNKMTDTAAGVVSQAHGCNIDVVINAYKKFKAIIQPFS